MTPAPPSPTSRDAEELLQQLRSCYWQTLRLLDFRDGHHGLTDRELLFLRALQSGGPVCSRALSATLRVTPANITRLSTGLEERHLVEKTRDPSDRRRVSLAITPQGTAALEEAAQLRQEAIDGWLKGVSAKEVRDLASTMRRLAGPAGMSPAPRDERPRG
jgi:DNA-binding MarR family transcriptional regulator